MDKQGYIDFNLMLSPDKSGKADSYARAIGILDEVLKHQSVINLNGKSLYEISDIKTIEALEDLVKAEVAKMRKNEKNIFDYGRPNQRSYPLNNFCSAALKSLKNYIQYEHDVNAADIIVEREHNPHQISKCLIEHFDLTKEGSDATTQAKYRKGQDYFRRMVLKNYGGHCALTGIDIPQLLLASHIIPWSENKKERLNPCNGICLSSLYDRAFDQGLIGFDLHYRTILSTRIKENEGKEYYEKFFAPIANKKLTTPLVYKPDVRFLEWHMDEIFLR
ncbi:HNH endonuclease [Bacteroides eggerthii]|uniref:HNH endonuclease n=1 Tax=Bacteroides eggerthii TaxID=28111 RepID=A0ABT7U764_9BACE|nr:HNH endonuclease [Bacteroides eggerthii]